ncbi:MAG: phosphoglucosamine mutase [Betaproteobacteria bacterium]|nr:phosphoglucosamine mutase [Betaproteobacteria bacterium]MDE2623352.1 phosphoglucosamine mutase [Betaproteobacteria bacterium]
MSRKYFGTDGIRGRVGQPPIVPGLVLQLGFAAGTVLTREGGTDGQRPRVVIGKDTRVSGYMLESALEAGLSAAGVDVVLLGPMPTPAVAYLTRALRLQAGIMISASHNPYDDNGIKFFSAAGAKLPDRVEQDIEALLEGPLTCSESAHLGRVRRMDDAAGRYIEFCKSTFPSTLDLKGLKLVVDCAHGATYHIAPLVFHELGAEVVAIGNAPNGININDGCGATHVQTLRAAVLEHQADLGIALDGDGDRLMMADRHGTIYDGDQLLYAIVKHRQEQGLLRGGVAGTAMTNLAVEKALEARHIPFVRTRVGDRYVLEALVERDWAWGGENSGHIICRDKHTTGDGIISALQVLAALVDRRTTLQDYTAEVKLFPQRLINVRTANPVDWAGAPSVRAAVDAAEQDLDGSGRVLLRPSGTEPLIRVMVEGADAGRVDHWAQTIAAAVQALAAG